MTESSPETNSEASKQAYLIELQKKPFFQRMGGYISLSGPGWLQSAITLGGGSLSGSLYLGVLAGFGLMWLQPLAMILGIVMLSAISYVCLSTGEKPFDAINKHINPVLGWSWAIASMMANFVWCMPQYALGTAAIQQNLLPGVFGAGAMDDFTSKLIIVAILFISTGIVIWFYNSGSWGIQLFELVLKLMVGVVVICFFGVVLKMTLSPQGLDWGAILSGFIPDFSLLTRPSDQFAGLITQAGDYGKYWSELIVNKQQEVMITAAATAVGINMTFLLPYSMLKKGWNQLHRELAIFDLAFGLFIPFVLATSCVVIAAASQFHAVAAPGLLGEVDEAGNKIEPAGNLVGGFNGLLDGRLKQQMPSQAFDALKGNPEELAAARAALPEADRQLAAMLVTRDAFNLANSLQALTGPVFSQYVFGIGVLGMAVSTIIILMLINGFVICEIFNLPHTGMAHRAGSYLAGAVGALGPFLWTGDAKLWLAVPTSMFGMVLLPIAYITFYFMLNSRTLMGAHRPRGIKLVVWNLLMGLAVLMAAFGSFWSIYKSPFKSVGFSILGVLILLVIFVGLTKKPAEPMLIAEGDSADNQAG